MLGQAPIAGVAAIVGFGALLLARACASRSARSVCDHGRIRSCRIPTRRTWCSDPGRRVPSTGWPLALVILAAAIALSGGLSVRLGGQRLTARSPDRAAARRARGRGAPRRARSPDAAVLPAPPLARKVRDRVYDPASGSGRPDRRVRRPWRSRSIALAGFTVFAAVLLFPQLQRMDSVPDLGDPLFSIWRFGWVFHKLGGDPAAALQPERVPSASADADLLRLDAPAGADDGAVSGAGSAPGRRLQPGHDSELHRVGVRDVSPGRAPDGIARGVLHRRPAVRVLSLPFRALQPFRAADDLLHAARAAGAASLPDRARAREMRSRSACWPPRSSTPRCTTPSSSRSMSRRSWCFSASSERPPLRRMLGPAVIAGALALALALPLARTYSSARLGDRDVATVTYYSATAADYLRAHPRSAMWGDHTLPGRMPERALFPGVMILLLAAVALIPPVRRDARGVRRALLVAFEMSRGFNSVFYPYLYEWLPFIRGLRVPARASILVGLTLALLAGFGVRRLLAGRSAWLQRGRAGRARDCHRDRPASGCCGSNRCGSSRRPSTASSRARPTSSSPSFRSAAIPRASRRTCRSCTFRSGTGRRWSTATAGTTRRDRWTSRWRCKGFPTPSAIDLLRARGATHVTINCALYRGGCEELVAAVDALPASVS